MRSIKIPFIAGDTIHSASDIPYTMDAGNILYYNVDNVNWPEDYPYCPNVKVAIAHDGQNLFIHFLVKEQSIRAKAEHDNEKVWEDSCCEFFIMPNPEDGIYYNIECNCKGTLLIGAGKGKTGRVLADREILEKIDRWTSLPSKETFEEREYNETWQLALRIPATSFFKHNIKSLTGMKVRINVYKCGDELKTPHFVSLFPIQFPTPNFHLPEFFKEATFGT